MKIQDIIFFVTLCLLLVSRKRELLIWFGLGSLVLAIPLFAKWVFFTAERLTWYAAAFFLCFAVISLLKPHKVQ